MLFFVISHSFNFALAFFNSVKSSYRIMVQNLIGLSVDASIYSLVFFLILLF